MDLLIKTNRISEMDVISRVWDPSLLTVAEKHTHKKNVFHIFFCSKLKNSKLIPHIGRGTGRPKKHKSLHFLDLILIRWLKANGNCIILKKTIMLSVTEHSISINAKRSNFN